MADLAKKDFSSAMLLKRQSNWDGMFVNTICYHLQQAIEKMLKYIIEINGDKYPITYSIDRLYSQASKFADLPEALEFFGGTLTAWEAASRYGSEFFCTEKQILLAEDVFQKLISITEEVKKDDSCIKKLSGFREG